ncbi:MAG: efflux RND transporter permease subunit [Terracidiphilus sp.]|jgi:cobalt-zinc-cadmium resistance protein CzcA
MIACRLLCVWLRMAPRKALGRCAQFVALAVAIVILLPAALSHAIGSDSLRSFAIVIVGGLITNLVIGIFLLPTLYVWVARKDNMLPLAETSGEI